VKIVGAFDMGGDLARKLLLAPTNPNGRPNADVLKVYFDVDDVVDRPSDRWVIDFGVNMGLEEAAKYELPFTHVEKFVKPERQKVRRKNHKEKWWLYMERPGQVFAKQSRASRVTSLSQKHLNTFSSDGRIEQQLPLEACSRSRSMTM
jgi:hypothetical protein